MDPNANLAEQRRIQERLRERERDGSEDYTDDDVDDWQRLAELTEALDDWIAGGGFLPTAWSRGQ